MVIVFLESSPALAWDVLDPPPYITIHRQDGDSIYGLYSSMGCVIGKGQNYSQNPIDENGRLLVPLRQFAEALGYDVTWNNEDYSISMTNDSHTVWMQVDNPRANKDGLMVELDVPPRIVNGRTMIPLRFVAETAGYSIDATYSRDNVYFISYYAYLSREEMQGLSDMVDGGNEDIYTTPAGIRLGDSFNKVIDTYGLPEDDSKKDNGPYPENYTGSFYYTDNEPFQCGSYGFVIDIKNGHVSRMYMSH
ncbi:MAG TPA: copper amine oxidase N-terminal domain-containing protein [Syntrophomonadaceae bacterium]|nr:copper amine oxidase N-terminal domain-containing protein [Syntrophomonadaceae bacterium]